MTMNDIGKILVGCLVGLSVVEAAQSTVKYVKTHKETKRKQKELECLKEYKRKEAEELERTKALLDEKKKSDPQRDQVKRLINIANRLVEEV